MFKRLIWKQDRMLLDNLVFRLKHFTDNNWELGDKCFNFIKVKELVDEYEKFFSFQKDFKAENIIELGLYDGGSTAFWFEYFQPKKMIGVDLTQREDSDYFKKFVQERNIEGKVKTFWGVSQADTQALKQIISTELTQKPDLVIDDASHIYGPTKISFEYLFPLLRPGGLYIIEDWAWEHWREFQSPSHPWINERSLTDLITELIEATGTTGRNLISNVCVFQGFTVIERGDMELGEGFKLSDYIRRRPARSNSLKSKIKTKLKEFIN